MLVSRIQLAAVTATLAVAMAAAAVAAAWQPGHRVRSARPAQPAVRGARAHPSLQQPLKMRRRCQHLLARVCLSCMRYSALPPMQLPMQQFVRRHGACRTAPWSLRRGGCRSSAHRPAAWPAVSQVSQVCARQRCQQSLFSCATATELTGHRRSRQPGAQPAAVRRDVLAQRLVRLS